MRKDDSSAATVGMTIECYIAALFTSKDSIQVSGVRGTDLSIFHPDVQKKRKKKAMPASNKGCADESDIKDLEHSASMDMGGCDHHQVEFTSTGCGLETRASRVQG